MFEGIHRNFWFIGIQLIIVGGQILIVFIGGAAFAVHPLNRAQWAYSLVLGVLSIPIGTIIRLVPDDLIARALPTWPRRTSSKPVVMVEDDEERIRPWNPAMDEIREELTFLKRVRGGRMSELAYRLQHPVHTLLPRSRSESRSRSRSNSDLPRTPDGDRNLTEITKPSPKSPDRPRRHRSSSNSAFGPAAAMAGIIAGSVGGGWSPVEQRQADGDSIQFVRPGSKPGLESSSGFEIHPDTSPDDRVIVEKPVKSALPPSQNPDLAPPFVHAPPLPSTSTRGRRSHSRTSSSNP